MAPLSTGEDWSGHLATGLPAPITFAAKRAAYSRGRASVPIEVVTVQRLYQRVAEQIARLIASGEYRLGGRLPPERDLARLLGISRTTLWRRLRSYGLHRDGRARVAQAS